MVAPWLASVKVPSRTVPVVIPSMPVISVPLELVSWASRTVTPPPGGLVSVVVHAAQGRDDDAQGVGQAGRRLLGVDVAAENLEDRCARIGRAVSGVTPICWTTSVMPATPGVPSPQPPMASSALTSATVASVLGSVKVASTNRPVSWPSTAVKFLVAPVIARSVTVAEPVMTTCEPPSSMTVTWVV